MSQQQTKPGVLARLLTLFRRGAKGSAPIPQYPIRVRPQKIEVLEEYHYTLSIAEETKSAPANKPSGEIVIDIPYDQMGAEAIADANLASRQHDGAIAGRYGWLAFSMTSNHSKVLNTDIHERFSSARPWEDPYGSAFPLLLPLGDKKPEKIEQRIEAGWREREVMTYYPEEPNPFPFRCVVSMSRDSAIPNEIQISPDSPSYHLPTPTTQSLKEMAIHVWLGLTLPRPEGVTEKECLINLDKFEFRWPVPIVASQFELKDSSTGWLRVDSHQNRLIVGGIQATFISSGVGGQLDSEIAFRILIKQPSLLQSKRQLEGIFEVSIKGMPLSGVRMQYFDSLGYPQHQNQAKNPLISYRTDIVADFTYLLTDALTKPPLLLERYYTWRSTTPFSVSREVEQVFEEGEFNINESLNQDDATHLRRWATRTIDGYTMILELQLEKQKEEETTSDYYQLTMRSYYEGNWQAVAEQLEWLEKRLRQRLRMRN